jgi:cell growth-regulating nucleolar protein
MGKLFQSDKSKREGAKQDTWLETVSEVLRSYKGPLTHHVERLLQYDNIPRKQKAFENFVANSLNLKRDPSTVRQLWNILEQCQNRQSTPSNSAIIPWAGFESETAEVLKRNGGSMPWKLLQANLAKRRKSTNPDQQYDHIRFEVLANVPDKFLSSSCNLVSLSE